MRGVVLVLATLVVATVPASAKPRKAKPRAVAVSSGKPKASKVRDRSIGAPWSGSLQAGVRLRDSEHTFLRRPARAFGTKTTVELIQQAVDDVYDSHPKAHVLAVGDLSASRGGWISEHSSHQSGRDVDLGLLYRSEPAGYPSAFVTATDKTLDMGAMWTLLSALARTQDEDGGVQMIFFDERLQSALHRWATKRDVSPKRIARVFRLLRHEPNHADHIHVRFKCRARDARCR